MTHSLDGMDPVACGALLAAEIWGRFEINYGDMDMLIGLRSMEAIPLPRSHHEAQFILPPVTRITQSEQGLVSGHQVLRARPFHHDPHGR